MREIDDCRKKESTYELAALLTACLAMYLFKSGSRNAFNDLRDDLQFRDNYKKLFKLPLPHSDTVNNVICLLKEKQVEQLKQKMVRILLRGKTLHKYRFRDKYFCVAIDGSGVMSFDHEHCKQCLHKTSKKGKKTYFHTVMEARIVTPNGFSISIASEWIENPDGEEYDKQDCERKAFLRLADKLKKAFPQLPILILADGLYPYQGFFDTCKKNDWAYIITFKDGNLSTVWEEVHGLKPLQITNKKEEKIYFPQKKSVETRHYRWIDKIDYKGHKLNWLDCQETLIRQQNTDKESKEYQRFVYITDQNLNAKTIANTSRTGRLRWKIENEGFNTLKNNGYGMKHKYSQKSYLGTKNYYQFMQMAYLIHQLMVKTTVFVSTYLNGKNHKTLKSIWQDMIAAMQWVSLDLTKLEDVERTRVQYRFVV